MVERSPPGHSSPELHAPDKPQPDIMPPTVTIVPSAFYGRLVYKQEEKQDFT